MLRLKSDLLSMVSHEFNNSLASMGMALLLLRENDEAPDQRRKIYLTLERIHQLLKTAVSNFLNQARMQSGRFQLDIRQIELRRLVAEVLELMRPLAEQKGIDLRLEFPETAFPVTADPDAMILVLSNLIGNAIKYTPGRGRVSVRLTPINGAPLQEVEVSVADTGIGIAAADQDAIFRGFYRTGPSQKMARGYGLGLAVSRQIMESHDSALNVESRPGQGSRFHFRLPVCRPDCPNRTTGLCHRCQSRNPLAAAGA
jgi:signal transduction histidine kinase